MSVLRVKRRRGVAPRIRTKRSTDADSASVMEGSPTVEKLQGMSLRDQDDRDTETSSHPTPEADFDMIPLPFRSDESDSHGDAEATPLSVPAAPAQRSQPRPSPTSPSTESAAIAAKRAQLQAALRDRPRWMARPIQASSAVAESVEASPPAAVAEPMPELPEEMPDAMIRPFSPPDWKAVFGDQEEDAAERDADNGEDAAQERPSEEPDTVEAEAPLAPNLSYLGGDAPAEADTEPGLFDLTYGDPETADKAPERMEDEARSLGDDDEPQHVFVEPPSLAESPAAQEARRRFRAAYDLYRPPYAGSTAEEAQAQAQDHHQGEPAYPADQDDHHYFDGYDEHQQPAAAMAEQPHYDYEQPRYDQAVAAPLPNPPSEALRRAATVASSRQGVPVRAPVPVRRPQPFEGASSNMREALDSLNTRGRTVRPDALRRTVAKQRPSSRSMSGAAVAAALLMSACGGIGIYAWKAGSLDAVMAMIPAASTGRPAQAAMVGQEATRDTAAASDASGSDESAPDTASSDTPNPDAATPPKVADDNSDQQANQPDRQTSQPDAGPMIIEATTTSEGPTGALPDAGKEAAAPAESSPPPLAEAPPVPESVPPPVATEAPPQAAPAKDQAKAKSTAVGKPSKKRFHTARLNVADVEGVEQQYIPLNLTMDTGDGPSDVQLRLSGLPEAAKLSAGQKLADGAWVVTAKDAAGLRVLTPDIEKPEHHTVAVEAVEAKTGSLAAPTQEMQLSILPRKVIVEPAAASADDNPARSQGGQSQAVIELPPAQPAAVPPPVAPAEADTTASIDKPAAGPKAAEPPAKPAKLPKLASLNAEPVAVPAKPTPAPSQAAEPSASDDDLIARGDELLSLGDIVAARQLYEFAFDRGQMQAAVALGRTYDPVTFEKLKVRGLSPNPQLALEMYKKAEKAGIKGAQADIEALSAWLAR